MRLRLGQQVRPCKRNGVVIASIGLALLLTQSCSPRNSASFPSTDLAPAIAVSHKKLVISTSPRVNPMPDWSWQNPAPNRGWLLDIASADDRVLWAVGKEGTIIRTNDGTHWIAQDSTTTEDLKQISCVDSSTAWALGESSVLNTANAGTSWIARNFHDDLISISAKRNAVWLISRSKVYKSSDGGSTWCEIATFTGQAAQYNAISAADARSAWVVGETADPGKKKQSIIFRTTDGGRSWNRQYCKSIPSLSSIKAVDKNTVWASGERLGHPAIIRTDNSGKTWQVKKVFSNSLDKVTDLIACSKKKAQVVLGDVRFDQWTNHWNYVEPYSLTKLYSTINGGISWSNPSDPGRDSINYLAATSVGDRYWMAGAGVLYSANAGSTWSQQISNVASCDLTGVAALSSATAWIVGDNGCILRTDDGQTWTRQTSGTKARLTSISAVNRNVAWVTGQNFVARTVDGGTTWVPATPTPLGQEGPFYHDISAVDERIAWLVIGNDELAKTEDSGRTWSILDHSAVGQGVFSSVSAVDEATIWAAGYDQAVSRSNDGGRTWTPVKITQIGTPCTSIALKITAFNEKSAVVALDGQWILTTSDAGSSWTKLQAPNEYDQQFLGIMAMSCTFATDTSNVWYAGEGTPSLIVTRDAGKSWAGEIIAYRLASFSVASDGAAWAVGDHGMIIKRTASY